MIENELNTVFLLFDKPLTSRLGKKYVEYLALSILQYCYDGMYDEFEVSDAPDIRDREETWISGRCHLPWEGT